MDACGLKRMDELMIVILVLSLACAFLAGVVFACTILMWRLRAERNRLLSAIAEDRTSCDPLESSGIWNHLEPSGNWGFRSGGRWLPRLGGAAPPRPRPRRGRLLYPAICHFSTFFVLCFVFGRSRVLSSLFWLLFFSASFIIRANPLIRQ